MASVVIRIAGTAYTPDIVFATAEFISAVNGTTGSCKFRVRDEARTLTFVTGSTIELLIDGAAVWTGYLETQSRVYAFPAENVADAGLTRWLDITGSDLNVLLQRRIVYNQTTPSDLLGTLFPADTHDDVAIADLVANFLNLSGDSLDTSTYVEHVASITPGQPGRAWSGGYTFGEALASIVLITAAVYFLDPARNLVYTDVNTASAPFALSDQPTGSDAGYREMVLTADGTSLINDELAWGLGYGSNKPIFRRLTDAASLALHGRWQGGSLRPGIYKQATIDRVAESIVDGSPSSHRGAKDDRTAVTVATYVPGFLPAQKVDFTSAIFGFSDVIPIRRMRVTFDAPDTPRYELTISHAIDSPWGFFDPYLFKVPTIVIPPIPVPTPSSNSTVANILDTFDNRSIPTDDVPTYSLTGGLAGGVWGNASSGPLWSGGSGAQIPDRASMWVTTDLGVGRFTFDPNRTPNAVNVSGATAQSDVTAGYRFACPIDDEPILSFRFLTTLIPDGNAGVLGSRGPTQLNWFWVDLPRLNTGFGISAGLVVSSVAGVGNLNVRGTTFAKTDWVANTWYTLYSQYLHNGDIRAKIIEDGGLDPGWQVTHSTGIDYVAWTGGAFFQWVLNTNDTWSSNPLGIGAGDVFSVELDTLAMGLIPGNAPTGVWVSENPAAVTTTAYRTFNPYVPNSLRLWRNGLIQRPGTDYTEAAPSQFTMTSAVSSNDTIYVEYLTA